MLNKIWGWIKQVFWIDIEPEEQSHEKEVPHYKTPDVWPFPGPRPTPEAVHKFYIGMETFKDHIMYRDPETGHLSKGLTDGKLVWNVRVVMWWLAEKEVKEKYKDRELIMVSSTCGMGHCVLPDHLAPRFANPKKPRTATNDLPKLKTPSEPQPEPKARKQAPAASEQGTKAKSSGFRYSDRTKCVSAKIWHPTLAVAQQEAAAYNKHRKPKGQPRLYGYECDWCDGAHFTKQNPNKRKKYKHTGSW